jgi:chloramphenicol 3-O phosphotransferase
MCEWAPRCSESAVVDSPQTVGRVILLNGASSSGKSSVARELQRQLPTPFLHLSIDHLRDSGALPLERYRSGEFVWADARENFFVGFERAVSAFAHAGNDLIVEYVVETSAWMARLESFLDGSAVFFVGVHCPLEELEKREGARGDRPLGDARRDFISVHEHCKYDLEVDGTAAPELNAAKIIAAMKDIE